MTKNKRKIVPRNSGGPPHTRFISASYEGPLPMPNALEKYEQILPGAAERIMAMAERQAQHRQGIEKVVFRARSRDSLLGVIFGFFIAITTVFVGRDIALRGEPIPGAILGGTGLAGLVGVFIFGTRENRRRGGQEEK